MSLAFTRDFVESYQEAKQQENEYACEVQMETCQYQCEAGQYNYAQGDDAAGQNQQNQQQNGDGDADEYCQYQCLLDAGMSYCNNENGGGQDMNMDELVRRTFQTVRIS